MTGSIALLDPKLNQLLMLTSPRPLELSTRRLPVGRNVARFETSRARDRLFVLSRGVQPSLRADDERPQLRIFDGGTDPHELERHELQDPYEGLELDPLGEWLVLHASKGLVSNPNELIFVELGQGAQTLPSKTLDSFGGKPTRFTFTSPLSVPGGGEPRRLLVVQREKDLAIIDLADLTAPEITIGMPERPEGGFSSPVAVAYHDAVAGEVGSMLAVQLASDSVYLLTLGPPNDDQHAFSLDANLVDVGGIPSTIDFVQTQKNGGLRLAALVPARKAAVLVDPASGNPQSVALPQGFDRIRRITDDITASTGQDVALLYGQTNTIAFWQLGTTTGTPYRSIDAYDIGISVDTVLDIPGDEFADTKILASTSSGTKQFYVLDLRERKSFPLDVLKNLTLNVSPDGQRLWAFDRDFSGFAQLTFEPLQPASLFAERPIAYVHDVATQQGAGVRSAIALHLLPGNSGVSMAATLFDAARPDSAVTRYYTALELGGAE